MKRGRTSLWRTSSSACFNSRVRITISASICSARMESALRSVHAPACGFIRTYSVTRPDGSTITVLTGDPIALREPAALFPRSTDAQGFRDRPLPGLAALVKAECSGFR